MSGPIVRSAPTKTFTTNWDSVFSGKKKSAAKPAATKSAKKAAKKKKK